MATYLTELFGCFCAIYLTLFNNCIIPNILTTSNANIVHF